MDRKSDLPYVSTPSGLERSNPVLSVNMVEYTDVSGIIENAGVSFELFPDDKENYEDTSRFLINISESGTIWVNIFGNDAAIGVYGNIPIPAGAGINVNTRSKVSIIGTEDGIHYTAGRG